MSWLDGRLPKWGPFGGGSTAVLEREETLEPEAAPDSKSPKLMVLVNDASGFACFKTHTFPDAESATEFVLYWFRHDAEGFSAFWALTEEPSRGEGRPSGTIAEPLAIIKDAQRADVVYSFSFVDMESAQAFVNDEIEHGTDSEQITLYWAVPVSLVTDARGDSMLMPSAPPGAEGEGVTEAIDDWATEDVAGVDEGKKQSRELEHYRVLREAPSAGTGVANGMAFGEETFELTSWIERARRRRRHGEPEETPAEDQSYETRFETFEREASSSSESRSVRDEHPLSYPFDAVEVSANLSDTAAEEPVPVSEPPATLEAIEATTEAPVTTFAHEDIVVEDRAVEEVAEAVAIEEAVLEEAPLDAMIDTTVVEDVVVEPVEGPQVDVEDAGEPTRQKEEFAEPSAHDRDADVQPVARSLEIADDGRADESNERTDGSDSEFITLEPADIVVHTNGHSKVAIPEPPAEATELPEGMMESEGEEMDDGESAQAFDIRIDIHLGSSRAMKVKRWEIKEMPFEGFKSPPGRF